MAIRPYLFYKKSELEKLKTVFEERVSEWKKRWLVGSSEVNVTSVSGFDPVSFSGDQRANNLQIRYADDATILVCCNDRCIADLCSRLLHKKGKITAAKSRAPKLGALEERLAHKALQDLIVKLIGNKNSSGSIEGELSVKWYDDNQSDTGQLLVSLLVGQNELDVIIPPQVADAMIDRSYNDQATVPFYQGDIRKLLTTGEVRCEVSLGGAGISLDELMSLQVGDVVKLNTSLNDACDLKFGEVSGSVKCLLGKRNDHMAVKIVGHGA